MVVAAKRVNVHTAFREQHSHKSTTESSACESFEENSEMETDQLLKQEVEEFIEKLMER